MTGHDDHSVGWTNLAPAIACDVSNGLCYRSFKNLIGQTRTVRVYGDLSESCRSDGASMQQCRMAEHQLERSFGPGTLTLIGVGIVIGAGIFVITGQAAAAYAGPAIVFSFVLAGLACVFIALCYAEMAAMVPLAGSAYSYTSEAFGRKAGWVVGWALVAEYLFGVAAIAIGWSAYMQGVIGGFGLHLPVRWASSPLALQGQTFVATGAVINLPAVLIIFLVTLSHLAGLRESGRFNSLTVVLKLSAVVLFITFGLAHAHFTNWMPILPPLETHSDGSTAFGVAGVLKAAGIVVFAYLGFDFLGTAAQETRDPQRNVPIAILATLAITTALFILVSLAMTGLVSFRQLNGDAPITTAIAAAGPSLGWLRMYVGIAVTIGLWAGLWPTVFAASRLFYSFSRDGFLPRRLSAISATRHVPHNAVILSGAIGMGVAGLLPIRLLGELISTGTLLAFGAVCAAVIRLRLLQPERERPFRAPYWQVTAALGIASCAFLLVSMGTFAFARIAVWQLIGLLILGGSVILGRLERKKERASVS
jgi:APA family basic amino acid/polyamine antiporter